MIVCLILVMIEVELCNIWREPNVIKIFTLLNGEIRSICWGAFFSDMEKLIHEADFIPRDYVVNRFGGSNRANHIQLDGSCSFIKYSDVSLICFYIRRRP